MLRVLVPLLIATLSGLGVGSAGLLVAFLTLGAGLPQLEAQGQNLLFFLLAAGAALLVHARRFKPLARPLLLLVPAGLLGSFLGVWLATCLPQALLRRLFALFLVLCGVRNLQGDKKSKKK